MSPEEFKQDVLPGIPGSPGVYCFYGKERELLYVGKALNLRKRVSSYFNKTSTSYRIHLVARKAVAIEVTVVSSEHDALLLENNLIKEQQPRYNIQLRDDKSYPFILIRNEPFPRIHLTRTPNEDGEYLGPFTSVKKVKAVLNFIRSIYQLRTCSLDLSESKIAGGKYRVCLEYQIGNCLGPCEGKQTTASYEESIREIRHILKGNFAEVKVRLRKEMNQLARDFKFEEAEQAKRKLNTIRKYQSKSTVVSPRIQNVDVIHMVDSSKSAYVCYMRVWKGNIVQAQAVELRKRIEEEPASLLAFALNDMRHRFGSDATEVISPMELVMPTADVCCTVPQRGDKRHLLELCLANATEFRLRMETRLDKHKSQRERDQEILQQLQKDFRLKDLPRRIECFDNSNIQGTNPVAAMVVFVDGRPAKEEYRHFHIRSVEGPDDFASMKEIVLRRYGRLQKEQKDMPDLILIDGGKGQLNAASAALAELGMTGQIAIAGIAKRLEEIYVPNDSVPLHIDKRSDGLKLVQRLRNEAHRFAITFHRSQRRKRTLATSLTDVEGVGKATAEKLLRHFRSVKRIREASPEEVAKVVGKAKAEKLLEALKK